MQTLAVPPDQARAFFQAFVDRVRAAHDPSKVAEGVFGAYMEVSLVNDGPITMQIDSKDRKPAKS